MYAVVANQEVINTFKSGGDLKPFIHKIKWAQQGRDKSIYQIAIHNDWTLDQWKYELQHRTLSIDISTPDAIRNATALNYFFTDAATPVNYFKGSELPDWEYTSATNCDDFNRGNTATLIGSLNAPNCTSAKNAFRGCANMTELKEKVIKIDNLNYAFNSTKVGGDYTIHTKSLDCAFQASKASGKLLNVTIIDENPIAQRPNTNLLASNSAFHLAEALRKITLYVSNGFNGWATFSDCAMCREIFLYSKQGKPLDIAFVQMLSNARKLQFIYGNARHRLTRWFGGMQNLLNLTQFIFSCHVVNSELGQGVFSGDKFDLPTVLNMANDFVGFPTASSRGITIGVAKYKLAKDISPEAREKFPLFFSYPVEDTTSSLGYKEQDYTEEEIALYNVGKTKYEEDNIVYIDANGNETTNTSQAVLNDYVLTAPDRDIADYTTDLGITVPVSGGLYPTGALYDALKTIHSRGWNITLQFN